MKGTGNSLDFGARIYDSRIGRWFSVDPLQKKYPAESPYGFSRNNPIYFNDIDGKDVGVSINEKTGTITLFNTIYVKNPNDKDIDKTVKKLNEDFKKYYSHSLKGVHLDEKGREWKVEVNLSFKVSKTEDIKRITTSVQPIAESLAEYIPGKKGSSFGEIGGNYMGMAEDMDHYKYLLHENIHNMGISDKYKNLTILNEKGFYISGPTGQPILINVSIPGYEGDPMGGQYDYNSGKPVLNTSTRTISQRMIDLLAGKILTERKKRNSDTFILEGQLDTDERGEIPKTIPKTEAPKEVVGQNK